MIGVYQIECLDNHKKYIGVSKDIQRRWREHRSQLFKGLHHSSDMQEDYNQYGEKSFEFKIIKECGYSEAKSLEEQLIQERQPEYNAYTNGKGNKHNTEGKAVEIENVIMKTIIPYFTEELENKKDFLMIDLFSLSKKSGVMPTQILRYLGVDHKKRFTFNHCLKQPYVIGLLPTEQGINVTFCREESECNDYYIVS